MKTDEQKTFWERLSEAMREAGKDPTQAGVADLLQIKQPSAYKYCHGGYPSLANAIVLAEKLRVCVEWLLTGRGVKRPMRADTARLVAMYEQLEDEFERGEIIGRLSSMIGVGRRRPSPPDDDQPIRPV